MALSHNRESLRLAREQSTPGRRGRQGSHAREIKADLTNPVPSQQRIWSDSAVDLLNASYFSILRQRLDMLGERQKLIAENLANASTPGYRPRDLDMGAFERAIENQAKVAGGGRLAMARTDAGHMPHGHAGKASAKVEKVNDAEVTIDGNAVVIEDQMMKAAETRMAYETSLALYQKGLQLVQMAARAPGR
jgi:flagellar basal-body rod protein FlgB